MTIDELQKNLFYLVDKYLPEKYKKISFQMIKKDDIPVNGILSDINERKVREIIKKGWGTGGKYILLLLLKFLKLK